MIFHTTPCNLPTLENLTNWYNCANWISGKTG